MITIDYEIMLMGYFVGLTFGSISSIIGLLINSAFRWMGY